MARTAPRIAVLRVEAPLAESEAVEVRAGLASRNAVTRQCAADSAGRMLNGTTRVDSLAASAASGLEGRDAHVRAARIPASSRLQGPARIDIATEAASGLGGRHAHVRAAPVAASGRLERAARIDVQPCGARRAGSGDDQRRDRDLAVLRNWHARASARKECCRASRQNECGQCQ